MSTRTTHNSEASLFYITFTCYQWLPLFELCNAYDLAYKWFDFLKEKYIIKTIAYTIMPNHVHCILFFPNEDYNLNKIVSNGKRFMAYEIIKVRGKRAKRNTFTIERRIRPAGGFLLRLVRWQGTPAYCLIYILR